MLSIKKRLFLCLLFLFLTIPFGGGSGIHYAIILFTSGVIFLLSPNLTFSFTSKTQTFPLIIFFIWLYGVIIAFFKGIEHADIFSNFAGMSLYITCYLFFKYTEIKPIIYKIVLYASIIVSVESIITVFLRRFHLFVPWPLSNISYNVWTSSIVMSGVCVLPFVLEAISLWNLFHDEQKKYTNMLTFTLASFACLYTTDSAGGLLAYVALFITIVVVAIYMNSRSSAYKLFSIFFVILLLLTSILYEYKTGIFSSIFSSTSSGNDKRYFQFDMVENRLSFWGNGLGSKFNAYMTEANDTYGIEISYLNLIDKFGFFSLFLLYIFIYSFMFPIINLIKGRGIPEYNVMALGLLAYLWVSIGNPVLFAPYNIVLHFIMLFLTIPNNQYRYAYASK